MNKIKNWIEKVKKAYGKLFKKALSPVKKTTTRKSNVTTTKKTVRKKNK